MGMNEMQDKLNSFIHKHLAKEVEYNAAIARQLGFKMPTNYDLGFSSESGPVDLEGTRWWMVLRLRLDDFSHEFSIKLPGFAHEDTDFVGDLFRCTAELVSRFITAHPEIKPDKATAQEVVKLLERFGSDEEAHKKAMGAADTATYTKESA